MSDLRTAAQQALEAMLNFPDDISDDMFEAITALKAALAEPTGKDSLHVEPVQEPVAWISESENLLSWDKFYDHMKPLYTTPPQRKRQISFEEAMRLKDQMPKGLFRNVDGQTADTIWLCAIEVCEMHHGIRKETYESA